ncbi:MBL fold metallo-hydrolase [Bacillus sp. FJAT-45350]|uniref:MBL fold metallo-hydrolase n=1 Tax=Bacillus sp. FJAT-45350 TaxID=2011014 RepID=UPI00211C2E0B|nr:MBL fold metallo-hydrolase [Bacillus sp. FJAT-45350]
MRARMYSIILLLVFILGLTACEGESSTIKEESDPTSYVDSDEQVKEGTQIYGDELSVHFIDVGQGDATLFLGPDFTILVDVGRHDRNDVVPYLKSVGVTEFDIVVGTHPHADHIGQLDKVLMEFPTDEVWMSGDEHTTRTYERVIDAIASTGVSYYEPRAGEVFEVGSLVIEVINPETLTGDFHEGSLALRAVYGDISFLLTGDVEKQTEEEIITRGHKLQSTIFQLGHHGSSTSNTEPFLKAVKPELAIYSAGLNNDYGHPHREVISLLDSLNIPIKGTDINGTIIINTDGSNYRIEKEKEAETTKVEDTNLACIDINVSSREELATIVHIGDERAEQLIEHRPYDSVEQLRRINGIGSGRLGDIVEEGLACVKVK